MPPPHEPATAPRPPLGTRAGLRVAAAFVVASGFSALVYQVLWLRDLGTIFGNTAQASAVGFAVFFAGLAVGAHWWGRRSGALRSSLAAYAWLELGIVLTAGLGYFLLDAYRLAHAPLVALAGTAPWLLLTGKAVLAAAVLFPPAFFMGGTIPVLGQAAIRHRRRLGQIGARLYGLNTLGAAAGALAAGFFLPAILGFGGAYATALAINAAIGLAAMVLALRLPADGARRVAPVAITRRPVAPALLALAAASGFLMLALEVAAVRLFTQVLQNSVYTFATVLVVFLVALSAGALAAGRLARIPLDPRLVLAALLTLSGVALTIVPMAFYLATDGLAYVAVTEGWHGYLLRVAATVALVLGIPSAVAGTVFPFLMRLAQEGTAGPGGVLGALGASNLAGAIAGSLATGFVLLPALGLWGVLTLLPAAYLVLALVVLVTAPALGWLPRLSPLAGLLLLATLLNPLDLPLLRIDPTAGERILFVREGPYGVTAVVEREGDRRIRVNNHYALGGSAAATYERQQGLVALATHPDPRSVFFLGMGTGITAGAAVRAPVERLVVAELIPDVVEAARRHFADLAGGLFSDPRVSIVTTDGRSYLAGTRETFDLVVADLFVPWEAGTGYLYTREHFQTVRDRLAAGGRFVQWLPLYQLSPDDFLIVARTMLGVFPHVTLWRGDFLADRPIVALVGSLDGDLLPPVPAAGDEDGTMDDIGALRAWALPFYAGHLSKARHLVPDGPRNTDRRPVLEYTTPIAHRQQRVGATTWFHGHVLLMFYEDLFRAVPPEHDPYLARLSPDDRARVRRGLQRYAAVVHGDAADPAAAGRRH
jgi:spermidine synthase